MPACSQGLRRRLELDLFECRRKSHWECLHCCHCKENFGNWANLVRPESNEIVNNVLSNYA